jgi:hypothetical protein
MDEFLINLKPILHKQWLHLLAGLMWSGVGIMLISLAIGWLRVLPFAKAVPYALAGIVLAFAIYRWGFSKLSNKNITRINSLAGEKTGLFAFQEWKSYPLVLFMIGLGITLRVYSPIPKPYLAVLYIGIGGGLFLASLHYYRHLWRPQTAVEPNEQPQQNQ